jgi:hypothetical protein
LIGTMSTPLSFDAIKLAVFSGLFIALTPAAAQDNFLWSFDGSENDPIWRGNGTGAAASSEDNGPVSGLGMLLVATVTQGDADDTTQLVQRLDFKHSGNGIITATPGVINGVVINRSILSTSQNQLRFVDQFLNVTGTSLHVRVVWGGRQPSTLHRFPVGS